MNTRLLISTLREAEQKLLPTSKKMDGSLSCSVLLTEQQKLSGEQPPGSPYEMAWTQAGDMVFMIGGKRWDPDTEQSKTISEFWVFDMSTLTWIRLDDMPVRLANGAAVYDPQNERIVHVGGETVSDNVSTTVLLPQRFYLGNRLNF